MKRLALYPGFISVSSKCTRTALVLLCAVVMAAGTVHTVSADTAPPSGTPATVSADALPTVQIDGVVWGQVTVGNTVYATGRFNTARPAGVAAGGSGTVTRSNLLAYDITTGKLNTSFVHSLGGSSSSACTGSKATGPQGCGIAASPDGSMLYVGGSFSTVDGQAHANLAAFDLKTNKVVSGFQGINNKVKAVAATNSGVYIGGPFTSVGGTSRGHLAYFTKNGSLASGWNATVSGSVDGLVVAQNKLIFGGSFTAVNGKKFWSNAAVSLTTGSSITPWASQNDSFPIHDVDPTGNSGAALLSASTDGKQVYFTSYTYITSAADRKNTFEGRMAVSATDGSLVWLNDCVGDSYSSFPIGQVLYSTGHMHGCKPRGFISDNPSHRIYHHAVAETTYKTGTNQGSNGGSYPSYDGQPGSTILNWFPDINTGTYTGMSQGGWSVTGNSNYVAYGGEFTAVNGTAQQGLVRFAVRSLAPNKIGPIAYPNGYSVMAYAADSKGNSLVRIYTTGDIDNGLLTYKLYRQGSNTLLASRVIDSRFWTTGVSWTFTDKGIPAGESADYRLVVSDPLGNSITENNTNVINDTDSRVTYSGSNWKSAQSEGDLTTDFARGIHYTTSNGSSYSFSFLGSGFTLIGETYKDRGSMSVSVDGKAYGTANAYAASGRSFQVPTFSASGLGMGRHTVTVTKTGGSYMDFDAVHVTQDKLVNDTSSDVSYNGTWTNRQNTSADADEYAKGIHYTTQNGASVTVTFTGSSFALLDTKSVTHGTIGVSIDGVAQTSASSYSKSTSLWQVVYSKSGLSSGKHTVMLTKKSGTYMNFDAIIYR